LGEPFREVMARHDLDKARGTYLRAIEVLGRQGPLREFTVEDVIRELDAWPARLEAPTQERLAEVLGASAPTLRRVMAEDPLGRRWDVLVRERFVSVQEKRQPRR
jgi:hypothetical protein